MGNYSYTIEELRELSNTLEKNQYSSILLTYKSNVKDRWMQVANIINPDHKLKYTIALRTYAISPEYTAMMFNSMQEMGRDKIQFNIISGEIADDEDILAGTIEMQNIVLETDKRIEYTKKWIKSFLNLKTLDGIPYIWMSGKSNITKQIANEYADMFIGVYGDYHIDNNDSRYHEKIFTKDKGVCFNCLIRETEEEALAMYNKFIELNGGKPIAQGFYGTEKTVSGKILDFCKKYGIKDVMVVKHEKDNEFYRVHDMVASIKNGGII
jgi:hypothetical protein